MDQLWMEEIHFRIKEQLEIKFFSPHFHGWILKINYFVLWWSRKNKFKFEVFLRSQTIDDFSIFFCIQKWPYLETIHLRLVKIIESNSITIGITKYHDLFEPSFKFEIFVFGHVLACNLWEIWTRHLSYLTGCKRFCHIKRPRKSDLETC